MQAWLNAVQDLGSLVPRQQGTCGLQCREKVGLVLRVTGPSARRSQRSPRVPLSSPPDAASGPSSWLLGPATPFSWLAAGSHHHGPPDPQEGSSWTISLQAPQGAASLPASWPQSVSRTCVSRQVQRCLGVRGLHPRNHGAALAWETPSQTGQLLGTAGSACRPVSVTSRNHPEPGRRSPLTMLRDQPGEYLKPTRGLPSPGRGLCPGLALQPRASQATIKWKQCSFFVCKKKKRGGESGEEKKSLASRWAAGLQCGSHCVTPTCGNLERTVASRARAKPSNAPVFAGAASALECALRLPPSVQEDKRGVAQTAVPDSWVPHRILPRTEGEAIGQRLIGGARAGCLGPGTAGQPSEVHPTPAEGPGRGNTLLTGQGFTVTRGRAPRLDLG